MSRNPLKAALSNAIGGQTTLIVAQNREHLREVYNAFVQLPAVQEKLQNHTAVTDINCNSVDFWPQKSVRFFHREESVWDDANKRVLGYPPEVPVILLDSDNSAVVL